MKQYKCLITLFAAALFMGACSDDDNEDMQKMAAILPDDDARRMSWTVLTEQVVPWHNR